MAHNLSLYRLRQIQQAGGAPQLAQQPDMLARFLNALPFSPTGAQSRVLGEISSDLEQSVPMLRLVQGDVGSGKTLVAAGATLQAIGNGYQVAIMAPTEILAEQHLRNFASWFAPAWTSSRPGWMVSPSSLLPDWAGAAELR